MSGRPINRTLRGVRSLSGVGQVCRNERLQPQAFIQLANQDQTVMRDPWNATFRKPLNVN